MSLYFSQTDLKVFSIPDFSGRMGALKATIRPKLEAMGEALGPELMKVWGQEFFAHTAKHMRRTVNPPDETWVAFGPKPRGYKANIHLALCVGKAGPQARVIMKSESELRSALGKNLLANRDFFKKQGSRFSEIKNFLSKDESGDGETVEDWVEFLQEQGRRLTQLKSAIFDVGFSLHTKGPKFLEEALTAFKTLRPLYQCGSTPGAKLS